MCSDASVEARMSRQQPRPHAHTCEGVNVLYLASPWASYFSVTVLQVLASRMDLEVVRDHLVRCAFLQTCAFNLASPFPREKPPPRFAFSRGLHIKFKK